MKKLDALRKKISKIESKMMDDKEKLAALRRKCKPQEVQDYELRDSKGKPVKLSKLFGNKKELIVIHNMGSSCPYCTLWADGFTGLLSHLENRAAFVIETPDAPKTQTAFAKRRGWKFKMVSSRDTRFKDELGYAYYEKGERYYRPGVSTFIKKGGKIFRFADTQLGPNDNFCVQWDFLNLLPGDTFNWGPKFKY